MNLQLFYFDHDFGKGYSRNRYVGAVIAFHKIQAQQLIKENEGVLIPLSSIEDGEDLKVGPQVIICEHDLY